MGETYIVRITRKSVHPSADPEGLWIVFVPLDSLLDDVVDSDLDRSCSATFPLGFDLGVSVVVLLDSGGCGGD